MSFSPGDCLLLYTDGVIEASNADAVMYGGERLRELVGRHGALSGAALIDRLVEEVRAFAGRSEFEDDLCVLSVESTGTVCALRPAPTYEI